VKGIYRFYLDNELIYEQQNALTTAGRSIIIKSLLGIIPNFANSIAYGIGNEPNTLSASTSLITNNSLQFESGRTVVRGGTLNLENNNDILIYSGVIDDPFQSEIREVGLYPSRISDATIGLNGSLLFDFDRVDLFLKFGSASAAELISTEFARIGTQLFNIPPTSSANNYLQYSSTDGAFQYIETFTSQDNFILSGYNQSTASSNVFFRFMKDENSYYDIAFTTPAASGYFISSTEKGAATVTGLPEWSDINFVRIWHDSSEPVLLDAMRIDIGNYFIDTNYGLISRAVLPTPIRKPASIPLTIEYSLSLGFNYGVS
jgi:hypothetical protein